MDITTSISALLTLAVFSFLYGDNPIYKFAERLLVGLAVGYALVITWQQTIIDRLYTPLFIDGRLALIVALILGLLMFSRFKRSWAWLSGIPLAAMIGAGAGAALPAMLEARIFKQLSATVAVFHNADTSFELFSAFVLLVGFITTLGYFYFAKQRTGALAISSKIGSYFLMIFFGATFGYTVMSRMSILIGRLDFLLRDWLGAIG